MKLLDKLFPPNKWDVWYESLPETTRKYLESQPVWHDKDMRISFAFGMLLGLFIGVLL